MRTFVNCFKFKQLKQSQQSKWYFNKNNKNFHIARENAKLTFISHFSISLRVKTFFHSFIPKIVLIPSFVLARCNIKFNRTTFIRQSTCPTVPYMCVTTNAQKKHTRVIEKKKTCELNIF